MKGIIYLVIFIVLAAAISGAVWYFKWSQAEMKVLNGNIVKLELVEKQQKETIAAQQADAKLKNEIITETSEDYEKSRTENIALRKKLAKHDIAYLASKRPKTVGRILTKGTADAERCFEILSGSPLTEKEKTATKKSQANGTCPELANPNYKARP